MSHSIDDRPVDARRRAAVVGAGISGLVSAYRLQQAGWDVRVFEGSARAGGRVWTVAEHGYLADKGATTLSSHYHCYFDLVAELGMRMVPGPPYLGVYRDGTIHLLRMDRAIRCGSRTRLLSWRSKVKIARLAFDVARARARGILDSTDLRRGAALDTETARDYCLRLANDEIDAYIAAPIARAMQIADTDCISRVELMSGLSTCLNARFSCLEGGQGALIAELVKRVGCELDTPVTRVLETPTGVEISYRRGADAGGAHGADVEHAEFDAAVISCPVDAAAEICPGHAALLEPFTHGDAYTQTISVTVGTTRPPNCPAYLVQMPTREDAEVAMVFIDSNKSPDRAPAGHGLLGVTWEKRSAEKWFERSDEEIVARTLQTVFKLFPELRGTVDYTDVARLPISLPNLELGAFKRLAAFHAKLDAASRVQFAADFMSEPGQNTAIALAGRAAANLNQIRSITVAMPIPPPAHSVTSP
jgi:oxygen-dependent protoporphyrinogen oxidase